VSYEADISGETYGDIDKEKHSGGTVLGIVPGPEFHEYIGEYRHSKSAYPDGVPTREKKECDADEEGIENEKYYETIPSDEFFHLISEIVEKEAIKKQMKHSAMEKLVEEELYHQFSVESLYDEKRIHPVDEHTIQKK